MDRVIFHIDVNSAFLSWTSVDNIRNGKGPDLRNIPAVIGGDRESRHGIVVAKSIPAKKYGIHTADTIASALSRCPGLVTAPPDRALYRRYSRKLMDYLRSITPLVEQASIDEAYMDFTSLAENGHDPVESAYRIKDEIKRRFGFTVNVGVSVNKLLAKMASDFEKPDRVHTLFPDEIRPKMWPLPVSELFMAGRSSAAELRKIGIETIGDLARSDEKFIARRMGSHGHMLWRYANGIDDSPVKPVREEPKGIGNEITLPEDAETMADAEKVLRMLSESVSRRLIKAGYAAGNLCVEVKYSNFRRASHQEPADPPVSEAAELYRMAVPLYRTLWNGAPVRLIGIRASKLIGRGEPRQISLFDMETPEYQKSSDLEKAVRDIKKKFGDGALKKGTDF